MFTGGDDDHYNDDDDEGDPIFIKKKVTSQTVHNVKMSKQLKFFVDYIK